MLLRYLTVAFLALIFVAALISASSLSAQERFEGPWDEFRVENVVQLRGVFRELDAAPQVDISDVIVLHGAQASCSFTITCNSDGTFNAEIKGCTGSQMKKIFEAAQDIC